MVQRVEGIFVCETGDRVPRYVSGQVCQGHLPLRNLEERKKWLRNNFGIFARNIKRTLTTNVRCEDVLKLRPAQVIVKIGDCCDDICLFLQIWRLIADQHCSMAP